MGLALMSSTHTLPRWNLSAFFPGLDSAEFASAVRDVENKLSGLERKLDELENADQNTAIERFDEVAGAINEVSDDFRLIRGYVHGFVTTDSRNEAAQARQSELAKPAIRLSKISTRFTQWVGQIPKDKLLQHSAAARDHEFAIDKIKTEAEHLMSPPEEALASDLSETGGSSWSRLHGNFTSQLRIELMGETQPISALRNMAFDSNRENRKSAYEMELQAWEDNALVVAACYNAIKGETITLHEKRGWPSVLDHAILNTNIDRPTLEAMLSAAEDAFPVFRRYLQAKSRYLGNDGALPWFDLFAPVGEGDEWSYEQAKEFVTRHFHSYSPKMGRFAERAFEEDWIDVPPADGKRDGAFCMPVRHDESRILMNFKPAFGAVSTLAHELGHAYHNVCLSGRTALQRRTPMTLAETASIFCETIVKRAALRESSDQEALPILEASLQGATQIVVDISSRFRFEKASIEGRAKRELASRELCDLMLQAQKETYGDGLDQDALHPYMWAAKPHYYSYSSYYNYPYMFGMLFGLGLYKVYQDEPEGFPKRYDYLLSSTGMADAATLGERFGIDIQKKEFWAGSLQIIAEDVEKFERLTQK